MEDVRKSKCRKMNQKTIDIISWVCIGISAVLIVFGFLAPSLLTMSSESYDFTETGQIGDTIGGTMSPFIAIAGVLMTFIAFLMQVRANEMQREQLAKSFNLKSLETEIDSRNALELLSIDIRIMLKNIDDTCQEIDSFCDKTDARPTGDYPFHFTPAYSRDRYRSIDRNLLFFAFKNFIKDESVDKAFMDTYSLMDFYAEGIGVVYSNIYKPFTDDIMTIKNSIPSAGQQLLEAIYRINNQPDSFFQLRDRFLSDYTKLNDNGILDVYKLKFLLDDGKYNPIYEYVRKEYEDVVSRVNALFTQNLQFSRELRSTAAKFREDPIYGKLTSLLSSIESSLQQYTIESLQNAYKDKI